MASHLPRQNPANGNGGSGAGSPRVPLLNEKEAAALLGLSPAVLKASRLKKPRCKGPKWVKFGRRVLYRLDDLERFIEENMVVPGV